MSAGNGRATVAAAEAVAAGESGPGEASVADRDSTASYGRGARILSIGIATTGLVTFAYFSVSSHVLTPDQYAGISLLWSVMFIVISIIYRPVEQLLSRTIAARRALGHEMHAYRVPVLLQAGFAALFLVVTLVLHDQLVSMFDGSETLYWVLVVGVLAYAMSYFARGWLAGHERFELYGGLVFFEAVARLMFPLAVAVGIASGEAAVALGIAAAPFASLVVVPFAFARRARGAAATRRERKAGDELSMGQGTGFVAAVLLIMLAEQTILNAAVLTAELTSTNEALAGFVFNVLLIARAPLQLFQSIQTSLLPHLAGLEAREGREGFERAIRVTILAIAAFALVVALGLMIVGPWAMGVLFGGDFDYGRVGLAVVALGMGLHLVAGTLNQAALARGQAGMAAIAWGLAAMAFLGFVLTPTVGDQVLRVELAYFGATGILTALLWALYRRRTEAPAAASA